MSSVLNTGCALVEDSGKRSPLQVGAGHKELTLDSWVRLQVSRENCKKMYISLY